MDLGLFKIVGYLDLGLFKIGGYLDLGLFKIKGATYSFNHAITQFPHFHHSWEILIPEKPFLMYQNNRKHIKM